MNTQEAIKSLKSQFASKDWFSDVEPDQFNNIVVYVKYLSSEVIKAVPDKMEGHRVLAHFAVSKVDNKKFITDASTWNPSKFVSNFPKPKGSEEAIQKAHEQLFSQDPEFFKPGKEPEFFKLEMDRDVLASDLDRLAETCGDNILQEILFEIRDGKNALTNFSSKYPPVREEMDRIYAQYGFDAINEEWE